MVLKRITTELVDFKPGASYVLRCGRLDRFQQDALVLWNYIDYASKHPVGITLLSDPSSYQEDDSHLELVSTADIIESSVTLHTSGTTGTPKQIRKLLKDCLSQKSQVSRLGSTPERWLLTFAAFRWAGMSVLLHAFVGGVRLIVPKSLAVSDIIEAAHTEKATHISITPSLLRKLVLASGEKNLRVLDLRQLTFGGEAVSQPVLDLAHQMWPNARLTHVYAMTEWSDICSVSDGLAGIPREKLDRQGFEFSMDGELFIEGQATGDLWVLKDNRYFFVGRREEVINVGGIKVSPSVVEEAALSISGVVEARAYAVASPLLGQVVGLDFCGSIEPTIVKNQMRFLLPKVACPVLLNRVEDIVLTNAGKMSRRP